MPRPDEGLIHAWLDGELDAAEAARVEALVASDAEWAAAAAEARGLVAAGARIVRALDRVPGNVIPKTAPRPASRRWIWRVAAALVLMAGSAVVLQRGTPDVTAPKPVQLPEVKASPPIVERQVPAAVAPKAPPEVVPQAPPAVAKQASQAPAAAAPMPATTFDAPAQPGTRRDKDAAPVAREQGASAAGAANRAAVAAPAAAPSPGASVQSFQEEAFKKTSRLPTSCFEQREPRDSATRIITLGPKALADSIRLERLALRGDTLTAVNGRLIAIRVPCPAP